MTRNGMIEQVKKYFAQKGGPMTLQEYKYATDAPIKLNVLKSKIGSWGRILKMAGVEVTVDPAVEPVEMVVESVEPVESVETAVEPVEEAVEPKPKAPAKAKGA